MPVEHELCEITGIRPVGNKPRQVFLSEIAKALDKLPQEKFDTISDAAAEWFNAAIRTMRARREIPEFETDYPPESSDESKIKTRYDELTGEIDKYGTIIGTQAAEANELFERGVTMTEIRKRFGSNLYNHLKKLQKRGVIVEKTTGSVWRIRLATEE